ncbi:PREDICTED: serine protease inhibitor Kazal-type 6-like [Crocodylus porosus]|uniref:serine protease inhibitor Kazal-type 6-like n=1 Tax=Crocodylus porosus TaxID=8502 RepID=UPI00093F7A38|nr:PREDICTED: serine protease inhibitor Kazal-type 6-like [Crocodylus porosus]
MKITGVLLLLTLAAFCLSSATCETGKGVDCSEYQPRGRSKPIYCVRVYDPFCGSDGKTYNNKCSFCKAVLQSEGKLRLKQAGAC